MSSDEELWKSGKSDENITDQAKEEEDTLDLSAPSPEISNNDDLDLSPLAISEEEKEEDNWAMPLINNDEIGISIKAIGVIRSVTILLLTGLLYILLAQQSIEIAVLMKNMKNK